MNFIHYLLSCVHIVYWNSGLCKSRHDKRKPTRREKRGGQKWCDDFGWMKALVLCCNFFFAFSVLLACGDYSKNQRTKIQEWDNVISSGGQKSSFTFSKERDGYKVFIR